MNRRIFPPPRRRPLRPLLLRILCWRGWPEVGLWALLAVFVAVIAFGLWELLASWFDPRF